MSGTVRKSNAPVRAPRVWLAVGRALSPFSAVIVFLARKLPGGASLPGRGRDVLAGRRLLVGPSSPIALGNGSRIVPGVFSEADLSRRMNLELSDDEMDLSYIRRMGPVKDLGILLRSLWALTLDRQSKGEQTTPTDHFNLFGVIVNNSDTERILSTIHSMTMSHPNLLLQMLPDSPAEPAQPVHVAFVNANNFNLALERPEYMKVLRQADLVLPDGIGVKIGLQMAGGQLRKNLNGTDLIPHLSAMLVTHEWPVFLLGATKEVLARAQKNLERNHPGLSIVGTQDGYFKVDDEPDICERINHSGAVALIIGMGTPRQELWAARNAARLHIPVVLSMGGLIDFLGEKNRRAPVWMRQAGLEWLFRLLQEPGRMWKRYIIGNPLFLWRLRRWIRTQQTSSIKRGTAR